MLTPTSAIKAAQDAKEAYHKALEAIKKESFSEMAKGLFEKHPNLIAVGWTQGTPGFNDGDPCVFSIYTLRSLTKEMIEDDEMDLDSLGIDDLEDVDEIDFKEVGVNKAFEKDLDTFNEFLGTLEDVCEKIFDGNSGVIITEDGITSESWDMGY